jgi:hypothetical protein
MNDTPKTTVCRNQEGCVMSLERELETYRRELPRLLAEGKAGRYAVVFQDTLAGVYDTFNDAMQAGYAQFDLNQFLVKKVQAIEEIRVFTRHIRPCPN